MRKLKSLLITAALSASVAASAWQAMAQTNYPDKPVMVVNPLPPGGSTDLIGRVLVGLLERHFGTPFLIENRAGAAGAVGNAYVANAPADGYTLLVTQTALLLIPEAAALLGEEATYTVDQLEPIARFSADPLIIAVHPDSPYQTIEDLIADIEANPGELSYSSSGYHGALHVPMEMFLRSAGLSMLHIPYAGGAPAVNALLGQHVDVGTMAVAAAVTHQRTGGLRPLLTVGDAPSESLPDVPLSADLGYPVDYSIWVGLFAPAGTPEPILQQLDDAVREIVRDEEFIAAMDNIATPIAYLDREEFKDYIENQAVAISEAVRAIGPEDAPQ